MDKKKTALLLIISLVFSIGSFFNNFQHEVNASTLVKNMDFFFHYSSSAVNIAGTSSNLIMNTVFTFQGGSQNFYKATGQPKISEDFYLYPPFAGNVTLSGNWVVTIFANSTSLHPATWNVEFWEKAQNGSIIWDSGILSPNVVGGPAGEQGYIDVPIYGYSLIVSNLTHSFLAGDTLQVEITVNTGSTVPVRLWYNSASYPSGMVLPATSYATPYSIITLNVNGTATKVFYTFWSQNQRRVIVNTYVSDPFGGYDISNVTIEIKDPTGTILVSNISMMRTSGNAYSYTSEYQYSFPYDVNSTLGIYIIIVSVIDNNGLHNHEMYGTYEPFIQTANSYFSLGIPVPVTFKVISASSRPLQGAEVELYTGGHLYASGITASDGSVNITVFSGSFNVKVYWEGTQVYNALISISNSTTIILPVLVFDPIFKVTTFDGNYLSNALVFVTYPNGSTGRTPFITNQSGEIQMFSQPAGNYTFLVVYDDAVVANTALLANFSWTIMDNIYSPIIPQAQIINSKVYTLTINVLDNSGHELTNVTTLVTSISTGAVFNYALTKNGTVSLLLPNGSYDIQLEYHNVWWLSYFSNITKIPVQITGDKTLTITMKNIPPPPWITLGFWLIIIVILVVVVGLFIYFKRRNV
jgi:hypothetical protein